MTAPHLHSVSKSRTSLPNAGLAKLEKGVVRRKFNVIEPLECRQMMSVRPSPMGPWRSRTQLAQARFRSAAFKRWEKHQGKRDGAVGDGASDLRNLSITVKAFRSILKSKAYAFRN